MILGKRSRDETYSTFLQPPNPEQEETPWLLETAWPVERA